MKEKSDSFLLVSFLKGSGKDVRKEKTLVHDMEDKTRFLLDGLEDRLWLGT